MINNIRQGLAVQHQVKSLIGIGPGCRKLPVDLYAHHILQIFVKWRFFRCGIRLIQSIPLAYPPGKLSIFLIHRISGKLLRAFAPVFCRLFIGSVIRSATGTLATTSENRKTHHSDKKKRQHLF